MSELQELKETSNVIPGLLVLPTQDGKTVEVTAPYVFCMDTVSATVTSSISFDDNPPLAVFKAVIVNSLEAFVANYQQSVAGLAAASEAVRGRKVSGRDLINEQGAMNLVGRVQARLDGIYARLAAWDGKTPFDALLPYAVVETKQDKEDKTVIDTMKSSPYVNGMLFSARWSDE